MRQHLNAKKVRKLAGQTGLDVVCVLVRGGTAHRRDLCLRDGSVVYLWPDGTTSPCDVARHGIPRDKWLR